MPLRSPAFLVKVNPRSLLPINLQRENRAWPERRNALRLSTRRRGSQPNANDFYLVVATSEEFGLSVAAESGRSMEFEPAKAIATNPTAMIKPRMAFALI